MACYSDIVGLRGLCDGSGYRYYVDDYGISLKTAAQVSDERYITGKRMFDAKLKDAWDQLKQDIVIQGFKHDRIIKSFNINAESTSTLTGGVKMLRFGFHDHCELTGIFIQNITLDVAIGGSTSISVNGSEIFNGTVQVGLNQIVINQTFNSEVQIQIDLSAITVNSGKGFISHNGVITNNYISETYGMSIVSDYRCDIESFICRFPDKIGRALVFKVAALMYKELMLTNTLAEILFVKDKESIMTEIAYLDSSMNLYQYEDKAFVGGTPKVAKGQYQIQLDYLNRVLTPPKCKCCIDCVGSFYSVTIP